MLSAKRAFCESLPSILPMAAYPPSALVASASERATIFSVSVAGGAVSKSGAVEMYLQMVSIPADWKADIALPASGKCDTLTKFSKRSSSVVAIAQQLWSASRSLARGHTCKAGPCRVLRRLAVALRGRQMNRFADNFNHLRRLRNAMIPTPHYLLQQLLFQ